MGKSIAVAGKGGTGKSTISSLIIHALCREGKTPILAIDSDPDSNLAALLGIKRTQTIGDLKEEMKEKIKNFPAGMTKANYMQAGLHEIIEETKDFDLITMGRSEGQSCYCYINSLVRKFYDDLSPTYKWTVIDNEAGLEHISRMTTHDIDALLIVVNDNPLSIQSAHNIYEITTKLDNRIKKIYIVLNAVQEKRKALVAEKLKTLPVEIICEMPFDPAIDELIYNGESLKNYNNESIIKCIDAIIKKIGS